MIVGYIGSAAWMLFVLARTGGNVEDPLFELIWRTVTWGPGDPWYGRRKSTERAVPAAGRSSNAF